MLAQAALTTQLLTSLPANKGVGVNASVMCVCESAVAAGGVVRVDPVITETLPQPIPDGPSNVAVTGPSSPFDTNGSQTLTLTCQPTTSNPSVPSHSWRRLPDGTSLPDTTSSISVVAATNLDGKRFECRASNSEFSQISATGTYTVNVNCEYQYFQLARIVCVYVCVCVCEGIGERDGQTDRQPTESVDI